MPDSKFNRPQFRQTAVRLWDTAMCAPCFESPNRRPLGFFSGGFHPHVESGFILVTSWNFDSYRVTQFGDDSLQVQSGRNRVRPRFVQCDGMFMHHTIVLASAMPTRKKEPNRHRNSRTKIIPPAVYDRRHRASSNSLSTWPRGNNESMAPCHSRERQPIHCWPKEICSHPS